MDKKNSSHAGVKPKRFFGYVDHWPLEYFPGLEVYLWAGEYRGHDIAIRRAVDGPFEFLVDAKCRGSYQDLSQALDAMHELKRRKKKKISRHLEIQDSKATPSQSSIACPRGGAMPQKGFSKAKTRWTSQRGSSTN